MDKLPESPHPQLPTCWAFYFIHLKINFATITHSERKTKAKATTANEVQQTQNCAKHKKIVKNEKVNNKSTNHN